MKYSDELEALSKARFTEGQNGFKHFVEWERVAYALVPHAEDFVRLLRAAEETREQLLRDFAIKCRCDFVTKLSAGIERCVGCRARDRIAAIDSALAPFEEK